MNVDLMVSGGRRSILPRAARHTRQRRYARLDLTDIRWSLGTQQVLMGLAAYQTRAR